MEKKLKISPHLTALDALCPGGYAIALHIRFTTPTFLFQTYQKEWIDTYSTKGYVMQDPTVRWGFENTGIKNWDELADEDSGGVLEAAAKYDLNFGFVDAIVSNDSRSVASFARPDRNFNPTEVANISAILKRLHEATVDTEHLPAAELSALKTLSVTLTHAGRTV